MAANRRKNDELPVALRLARGDTIAEAATACGIAETTIYRWLKEPQYQSLIQRLRGLMLGRAVGKVLARSGDAADAMFDVLDNPTRDGAKVKLEAARAILDYAASGRREVDWEERWQRMEERERGQA